MASLSHKILSAEPGLVLIHQLLKPKITNKRYYQQSLTLCKYHWILKYKINMSACHPLKTVSYSFIGDFFVALHAQSFCIWSKAAGKQFANILCCYSKSECPSTSKNSLKLLSEDVNSDVEVSTDGRLVLVLCESSSVTQVWHNKVYQTSIDSSEVLDFSLASFSLEHEYDVLACKFKPQNFFETMAKYIPNIVIAVTADYKVHLWVESFVQSTVEFFRFETISDFTPSAVFPHFAFARRSAKGQTYSCSKEDMASSKLISPQRDRVYKLLTQVNELGICKGNYASESNDWICFITVLHRLTVGE